MKIDLMRDALRDEGWWLLVEGSEQSYVDTSDPLPLEFEYVQMISQVLSTAFDHDDKLTALHLGGGLLTLPRWIAARHPGSRQRVAEHSAQIAKLATSLGMPLGVRVLLNDAYAVASATKPA